MTGVTTTAAAADWLIKIFYCLVHFPKCCMSEYTKHNPAQLRTSSSVTYWRACDAQVRVA
jgi:hypothetical protein